MKNSYLIAFCLLLGNSIMAQEMTDIIEMDEAIILDHRFHTPIQKDNRNMEMITKKDIENSPVKSIQEILLYAGGVDLRQRGPMGTQADISMDGGSFEQTLLLVNGMKVMDSQTAHNVLNLPLPLNSIERIEIIRGPSARIFGVNSLTGVINIITTKPSKSSFNLHTYLGSNFEKDTTDSPQTFINYGLQIGGSWVKKSHQHQLFLSHEKGNGYRYNTAFENNKLFYENRINLHPQHVLKTSWGYVKNGFGANAFYAAPGDKDSKEIVETTFINLEAENKWNPRFTIKPRLSYRYNFDDYRYFNYDLNKGRSRHYSHNLAAEINSLYQLENTQLNWGLEFRHEKINSTNIREHSRNNLGFYAGFQTERWEKFNLNLSAYLNYNSQYGWQLFPGIDASYQLTQYLKILTNIGTSQRIPSFTDLYLDQRPGNIGNENLKPETAFQTELGLKYKKHNTSLQAFFFYRTIDDFIDWTRDSLEKPFQATNFGNLQTQGFNLHASYRFNLHFLHFFDIQLKYTYLDSTFKNLVDTNYSKYKMESLKHQFIQTLTYHYNDSSISLSTRYNTRFNQVTYWVNDLRLQENLNDKLSIYLDVQNLFNTHYSEIGSVPLPSRWFSIGLKFRTN